MKGAHRLGGHDHGLFKDTVSIWLKGQMKTTGTSLTWCYSLVLRYWKVASVSCGEMWIRWFSRRSAKIVKSCFVIFSFLRRFDLLSAGIKMTLILITTNYEIQVVSRLDETNLWHCIWHLYNSINRL